MSRSSRGVSTVMACVMMMSVTVLVVAVAGITMMGVVPAEDEDQPTGEVRYELLNDSGDQYVRIEVQRATADTLYIQYGEERTALNETVTVDVERGEEVVVVGMLNGTERGIDTYVVPRKSW